MIQRIIAFLAALAMLLAPPPEAWEPDPADIAYVSQTIWGETRGCPTEEQEGVGWCIVLRKNSPQFPDTIRGVVLQPNQWQGYSPNNPAEPFREMARDILIRDHNGEAGAKAPTMGTPHISADYRSIWGKEERMFEPLTLASYIKIILEEYRWEDRLPDDLAILCHWDDQQKEERFADVGKTTEPPKEEA